MKQSKRERQRVCVCVWAYFGALAWGLRARSPTLASLRVAWQGAFGADRARGSTADLGYVCSVVAWPCPVRSRGCCRLDHMLYIMVYCCRGKPCCIWKGGPPFSRANLGTAWQSQTIPQEFGHIPIRDGRAGGGVPLHNTLSRGTIGTL